mmetsp:Transcript_16357/g.39999  ORF Transcript_16357/g.39999 Transcript_16357/m.39999 type:complete len:618 (-) Transcript_16357:1039-2892(-)
MDDTTRKVVADVVRRCRETGNDVTPTLACFMVRTMQLQGVALADKGSTESFEEFCAQCSERLTLSDSPSLQNIKMQIAVEEANVLYAKAIAKATRERDERAATMEREIISAVVESSLDEVLLLDNLYRTVFRYVAVAGGMEIALSDAQVEAETFAALESVFPHHGLRRFFGLSGSEKAAQLKELASIVLGIRIFNRSIGKGGRRLEDPAPPYLAQAAHLREDLGAKLMATERLMGQYAGVISFKAQSMRPGSELLVRLRDEQTNRQAYASALRRLIDGCAKGAAAVASLADQLSREVVSVQQLVGAKNSVPKEKVYPRLDALGALHFALAEERRAQGVLQRVADRLVEFTKPFKTSLSNQLLHETSASQSSGKGGGGAPLLDDAGPGAVEDPILAAAAVGAEVMDGGVTMLQYAGYDLHALVKRTGLLIPANAFTGTVVSFSGKFYGFAGKESALQFAAQPEEYIKDAMDRLRAQPELIYMMGVASGEFPTVDIAPIIDMMSTPQSCDFGTQTPTHFVENNIDKDYEWNEWALRQRALHLANLRQKQTHGAQTYLSHFRRENTMQVWLPKESSAQTAVAKGTTMPQPKRYIGGVRGGPEATMNVVSLELDIGQPHEF